MEYHKSIIQEVLNDTNMDFKMELSPQMFILNVPEQIKYYKVTSTIHTLSVPEVHLIFTFFHLCDPIYQCTGQFTQSLVYFLHDWYQPTIMITEGEVILSFREKKAFHNFLSRLILPSCISIQMKVPVQQMVRDSVLLVFLSLLHYYGHKSK